MDLGAIILAIILALAVQAQSLSFQLERHDTKCLAEEIHTGVLSIGNYAVHASTATTHRLHARVTSPTGHVLHTGEGVAGGQFSFKAEETGTFLACFWLEQVVDKEAAVTVDLDWKLGVNAKNWGEIAKRDKIEGMELELRKLEDLAASLIDEMHYLREKEDEMNDSSGFVNQLILWMCPAALFFMVSVASLQFTFLKSFFERKKLL